MKNKHLLILAVGLLPCHRTWALEAGKAAGGDQGLYEQSIKSTKQSIDREMIEALYHDAVDAYRDHRYDEALELLDKIYSLDPHYEDVGTLRNSIRQTQQNKQYESTLDTVRSWMKKGKEAQNAGQKVMAVSFYKQALAIDPNYAPAKKKIDEVNQALAKKEFESGYIHYHHGEMEDALESWSNAIALDPTYKQRGLLLLMSKIELQVKRDQVGRLAAQGFDQYQQGLLEDALHSYEELSALEPRHEEARRMTAKIKIQLGQAALKAAKTALAGQAYAEAIQQADRAIRFEYQVSSANAIKNEAERALKTASLPKPQRKVEKKPVVQVSSSPAAASSAPPPPPPTPANPEEAMIHYRRGLAAVRTKDYHLAMQELDIATQLDPTNEHIYIARQRAQQEWSAASNGDTGSNP